MVGMTSSAAQRSWYILNPPEGIHNVWSRVRPAILTGFVLAELLVSLRKINAIIVFR